METLDKKKLELLKSVKTEEEAFSRLVEIIKILRVECPWDAKQTHQSLKSCMIEEAYEVCDAIYKKEDENLREELGDVQLQVVFHGLLGEEREKFTLADVLNDECEKMIRRHPHVFSEKSDETVDKVLEKWENIKRGEHHYATHTDELKGVPSNFPALMRSYKVQKKAASVGFDWENIDGAMDKLNEELGEFIEASNIGDRDHIVEEVGDLLFSVVNVCRFLKINPEEALTASTEKFINRFEGIEKKATKKGQKLDDMTLEEMDVLWDEVKAND